MSALSTGFNNLHNQQPLKLNWKRFNNTEKSMYFLKNSITELQYSILVENIIYIHNCKNIHGVLAVLTLGDNIDDLSAFFFFLRFSAVTLVYFFVRNVI